MSADGNAAVDLLPAWQAAQAQAEAVPRQWGVATREQVAGKSGVEFLRALIAGELPAPPITRTLDFILVEVGPGRVVFQGRPAFAHYNPLGSVHGGRMATADGRITGPDGRLYAHASTTCFLFDQP